ncbi:MAG: type II toxin-antitoxin system VapC family toxin [Candidatus Omnitrophica bacterium]|nr:type II toxin-antitoxin system VapC family toxin [Candidatus Omnitrophota bacterium]
MGTERLFVDTSFVQAWFNRRDQYHEPATRLAGRFLQARELWTSEAVLLEIATAFRAPGQRPIAVRIWDRFHSDPRCHLVSISGSLLQRAMELFRNRPDKAWSLTDCISFLLMSDHHLTDALACDHHFVQAGFRALLLEEID